MRNYPAIFHLRVCRAKAELQTLSNLLKKMHECCQRDKNGEYSEMSAVDNFSLEQLEILATSVADECKEAKSALQWHQQRNSD